MPHYFFVNDNRYSDVLDLYCIQQAVATKIEAIYILLGDSDLLLQQDLVSLDILEDMPLSSCILLQIINTQMMEIEMPPEFIAESLQTLHQHWGKNWKALGDELESILPPG